MKKTVAMLAVMGMALSFSTASYAAAGGSQLQPGETLQKGQHLVSPNGQYFLEMQYDGNLVLYGRGTALWSTGTGGNTHVTGAMLYITHFGLTSDDGRSYWMSSNGYIQPKFLNLQDDGNLVLYSSIINSHDDVTGYYPIWDTGTWR